MRRTLFILTICALAGLLRGQTADDLNAGARLTHDPSTGASTFSWWGRAGHTYFIQESEDLIHWNYFNIIDSGPNDVVEWEFTTSGDRLFLRLRDSDISTSNPFTADFDGDGLSNQAELNAGLDPLLRDSDGDGMPDGWEVGFGLNPLLNDSGGDLDGDGTDNLTEYLQGRNPTKGVVADTTGVVNLLVLTPLE